MYSHRIEFLQESSYSAENDPSKIFSCIRASANTGPACIRAKINSPRIFPACIGFVPGGTWILTLFNTQWPSETSVCRGVKLPRDNFAPHHDGILGTI